MTEFFRFEVLYKLEKKNFTLDRLREMDSKEIGHLIHHVRAGGDVKKAAMEIPVVELEATIQVGNGSLHFTNIISLAGCAIDPCNLNFAPIFFIEFLSQVHAKCQL